MNYGMNISGAYGIVGLRWYATMNDWMDCCVYVPVEFEAAADTAIRSGVELFWEEDSLCYGDCIESKLIEEDIPYFIEYADFDEEVDAISSAEWESHFDYLRGRDIPIHNVLEFKTDPDNSQAEKGECYEILY